MLWTYIKIQHNSCLCRLKSHNHVIDYHMFHG